MKVQDADVTVGATELATGNWQVDFVFPEPQSALIFSRSNGDYRTASWVPIENASPVRRVGGFDSLIFETPQTQFSYEITPYTQGIPQDYTPFLAFTGGGSALYTGQFEVLSVADTAEIEALGGNLQAWQGEQPTLSVRIQFAFEDCENPRSELSHLLSVSGLEPVFDENGALVSLKVPA